MMIKELKKWLIRFVAILVLAVLAVLAWQISDRERE